MREVFTTVGKHRAWPGSFFTMGKKGLMPLGRQQILSPLPPTLPCTGEDPYDLGKSRRIKHHNPCKKQKTQPCSQTLEVSNLGRWGRNVLDKIFNCTRLNLPATGQEEDHGDSLLPETLGHRLCPRMRADKSKREPYPAPYHQADSSLLLQEGQECNDRSPLR